MVGVAAVVSTAVEAAFTAGAGFTAAALLADGIAASRACTTASAGDMRTKAGIMAATADGGMGRAYDPYSYGWDYDPGYSYYGSSQPYASQTWYYCSDPAGYYPPGDSVQHRVADSSRC